MSEQANQTARIREQNDRFRIGIPSGSEVPGHVMLTTGVQHLTNTEVEPGRSLPNLFHKIRTFDNFDSGNDPYSEHDFGSLVFENETVFWKIDYYTPDLKHGSEDPSDLQKTMRVLTIMLASEY